ncbi:hypothetical protein HPB47_013212 [Ixodes persulcatus]|uniref:Uncharacterized protein n=1 Tax=Ixodes persulcatus TaxID=34615 RepID=A0AC60QZ15_IXOPE|nr:hypothetical protein HPB47_013212 [Ixodes persulcatus]
MRQSGNAAQPLSSRHEKGRQKGISELDDMACASHQVVFPITGWENNLAVLPLLSEQRILDFYSGRSSTERSYDRGYNLSVESYLIPSSVRTNSCKQRYGIMNEPLAAKRYEEVLRSMGHDVTITSCGLLVNPAFPWLGASPDRIVYDPEEASYGVVEIKCPYSLRETKGAELAGLSFYSKLSDSGPRLDRDNHYYSQVVGQMGVSGLSWADFVIYSGKFILIERIRLVQAEWDALKIKVEEFYFTTLLPYLGGSR